MDFFLKMVVLKDSLTTEGTYVSLETLPVGTAGLSDLQFNWKRISRFAMECRHTLFTDFLTHKSPLPLGRMTNSVRQWSVALFLTGSLFSVPAVSGQGFTTPPTYVPKVCESYFFGDSNDVYPDPYQNQPQDYIHFEPAPGVSNPVPDQEVRARNRSERRERIQKLISGPRNSTKPTDINTTPTSNTTISDSQYGHAYGPANASANARTREPSPVHWEITYPQSAPAPNGQHSTKPVTHALRGTTATPMNSDGNTPAPTLWNSDGTTSALPVPKEAEKNVIDKPISDLILEPVSEPMSNLILEPVPVENTQITPKTKAKTRVKTKTESPNEIRGPRSILVPAQGETTPQNQTKPEMSGMYYDSAIQQVAFFTESETSPKTPVSSELEPQAGRRIAYPTRRQSATSQTQSRESIHFPWSSQKEKAPRTNSARIQTSDMTATNMPLPRQYPQTEFQLPKSENPMIPARSQNHQSTFSSRTGTEKEMATVTETEIKTNPVARSILLNPMPITEENSYENPHSYTSTKTSQNMGPARVPNTYEPSSSEPLIYEPVFPEEKTEKKITQVLPERKVFQDFGLRKTINQNSLPWYAVYIPDLNTNEEQLFNTLRLLGQSKLSQSRSPFSLIEAGILASHPQNAAEANRLVNIYDNIEYHVLQETRAIDVRTGISQREKDMLKAETILNFMHERVFVQYRLEDTTFSNLLERGFYNCVTASTLYCALAESAGLKVTAVELPGHAMCWVYLPNDERLEVETTCRSWFQYKNDPKTQKKVICDLIRAASPQLKDQSDQMLLLQVPQPISDKRLIAKIYYNRGVDLLSVNDFSGALEANAIAYCLDPQSETTQGNLLATMNNWAIALCKEKKYKLAANLLRTGISHAPTYPPFKNNHTHVYHLWVDSLYQNGDLEAALQIAKQAEMEQPDVLHFQRLQRQINETIATLPTKTPLR